jgi:hypothetical protein
LSRIFLRSLCSQLERFLIENRDEYLRHSSKNYTAEQKQYNNRLTEELLEIAEQYHYVFDRADFNFVAIRDRIRCYYKSYVQTARKRGLQVAAVPPSSKRPKIKKESKGTDTETDTKVEEKVDVVVEKETDDKQSYETNEDDKKIEENMVEKKQPVKQDTGEKVAVGKDTSDDETVDKGATEDLDAADAKEVHKAGAGK